MFKFLTKYSPDYSANNLEGWSVILVVAAGFAPSTFAKSWLGLLGLYIGGILCAHIIACFIKYLIVRNKAN